MSATIPTSTPVVVGTPAPDAAAAAEALAERLFAASLGGKELLTVELGRRTGLYAALADHGPATASEVARTAGVAERYAREFLEQQTAAGFLACDDPTANADERRYRIPAGHGDVLLDEDHPMFLAPLADAMAGLGITLQAVVDAYRTGAGVPFHGYGREIRHGLAQLNRAMFVNEMAEAWLPALGTPHERIRAATTASIVDLGCGSGASTIALALAYPHAEVHGVDLDVASIEEARDRARATGVAERVTFEVADAATVTFPVRPDLVTAFEMLHDTGDPVQVLANAAAQLDPDGALLLADERVADEFTPDADEVERFQFAWSVLHCLPATMAEDPVHPHGTILRRPTVFAWGREAGFADVTELDVDNDFWRFYRFDPAR
jgi:SAM-dependent methyltransferase